MPQSFEEAAKFLNPLSRRRWLVSRTAAHGILACYATVHASQVTFVSDERGKPLPVAVANGEVLHFSISHSAGVGLVGICGEGPIGIDLEEVRPMDEFDAVLRRFFHRREIEGIDQLAGPEQTDAFYRCWARKEAILKAVGLGLDAPLHRLSVGWTAADCNVHEMHEEIGPPAGWTLIDLPLFDDFPAALATQHVVEKVVAFHWRR